MDMKTFKVKNRLVVFGILFAAVLNISCGSTQELLSRTAGSLMPAPLLILYRYSMLGAADIKLFCMAGFYLGLIQGLEFIAITFVFAAAVSLYRMISNHHLRKRFFYFLSFIRDFSTNEKDIYMDFSNKDKAACIHMTVPMAAAAAAVYIRIFL